MLNEFNLLLSIQRMQRFKNILLTLQIIESSFILCGQQGTLHLSNYNYAEHTFMGAVCKSFVKLVGYG